MPGEILRSGTQERATLTISHPARRNALTVAMWRELAAQVRALSREEGLRCIVIRGATAAAFSAGADISEFAAERATHAQVVRYHEEVVGGCLGALDDCPVPVIAAIRGACFGGGLEIAIACDIRIACEDARLGAPVGRMGFPLALGETEALFRLVGPSVAAELLIEGRVLDAHAACARGLVSRVAGADDFEAAVTAAVEGVCASGLAAARAHKRQIRRLMRDPSPVTRDERMAAYDFAESAEYQRGFRAFLAGIDRRT